jgi:hypothetical protein
MKRLVCAVAVTLLLPLSCSEPDGPCPRPPDYSTCGAPLDAAETHVTYSEALARLVPSACAYAQVFRGSCADGKRIIRWSTGFGSSTGYYVGEKFVGGVGSGDSADCSSQCPFESFSGTLESVHCESPQWEPLCPPRESDAAAPLPGLPSFADGKPRVTCEALCGDRPMFEPPTTIPGQPQSSN